MNECSAVESPRQRGMARDFSRWPWTIIGLKEWKQIFEACLEGVLGGDTMMILDNEHNSNSAWERKQRFLWQSAKEYSNMQQVKAKWWCACATMPLINMFRLHSIRNEHRKTSKWLKVMGKYSSKLLHERRTKSSMACLCGTTGDVVHRYDEMSKAAEGNVHAD